MTDTKTTTTIDLTSISIEFETDELKFLNSVLLFSLTELVAKQNETHSGVDKLLYDTWIQNTRLAIDKVGKALASTRPLPPFYEASVEG
jgi:hypothetical protein